MDAIELYKKILSGEIERFPNKYWVGEEGKKRGLDCTKYLLFEVYKLSINDVKKIGLYRIISKNKLEGMLKSAYNSSVGELYKALLPNEDFDEKRYKRKFRTRGKWQDKENRESAIYEFLEKEGWTKEDAIKKMTSTILRKNGLEGLLSYYGGSPLRLLQDIFGDTFKPWERGKVKKGFWDIKENRVGAIRWAMEKEGYNSMEEMKNNVTLNALQKYKLKELVITRYDGSIAEAIMDAYPNQFRKSDFQKLRNNRSKKDIFEEEERLINESKELYNKYETELNEKIKDIIIKNAMKGIGYCEFNKNEVTENDIVELKKQGMTIEENDGGYLVKWL